MFNRKQFDEVETVVESDDGVIIQKGIQQKENRRRPLITYWVELPNGDGFELVGNYQSWPNLKAFVRLWNETEGFPVKPGTEWVPLDVVLEGTAGVAVYLRIVGQMSRQEVANRMGVKDTTIRTYISEYRSGKR